MHYLQKTSSPMIGCAYGGRDESRCRALASASSHSRQSQCGEKGREGLTTSQYLVYLREVAQYYRTAYSEEMERQNKHQQHYDRLEREFRDKFKRHVAAAAAIKVEKLEVELRQKYETKLRKTEQEKQNLYNIMSYLKKRNQTLHIEIVNIQMQATRMHQSDKAKFRRLKSELNNQYSRYLKLKNKFDNLRHGAKPTSQISYNIVSTL